MTFVPYKSIFTMPANILTTDDLREFKLELCIHPSKYILQIRCAQSYLCEKNMDMRYDTKQIHQWIKAWEQSGMSICKYCEDKPFDKSTFYNWRKKHTEPSAPKQINNFVPLQVTASSIPLMSIHYPHGVRVDVHMGLSIEQIKALTGC
jgi:hypothetical protein